MGQHRIARAEDAVVAEVDIDFLLEGFLHIDLGDDPEAFLFEAFNTASHGLIKADRQRLTEIVTHRKLPFAIKTMSLQRRSLRVRSGGNVQLLLQIAAHMPPLARCACDGTVAMAAAIAVN